MQAKPTRCIPFHGLKSHQWWRLAIVSILVTYTLIMTVNIKLLGLFNYVGLDFRTFYTSAQIAYTDGFANIYKLEAQQKYQLPLYESYRTNSEVPPFETVPIPYFPVFILPFFIFLPFSPPKGFALFTLINLSGLIFYSRRLVNYFGIKEEKGWVITAVIASIPVFFNLFYGQVNLMLFIALGEFMLALQRDQTTKAGLWLSIWMIKPQALLFILPWLLFSRKVRVLAGFSFGALSIYISSSLLAGWDWPFIWLKLLALYPQNLSTTNPLAMMNWRSLALNLALFLNPLLAWGIAGVGLLFTTIWAVRTWNMNNNPSFLNLTLLVNLSATMAVTWHAHLHMAAPLMASMIGLMGSKLLSYKLWMNIIGVQFLGLIASIVARVWFPANNLLGLTLLGINVFLVYWGFKQLKKTDCTSIDAYD